MTGITFIPRQPEPTEPGWYYACTATLNGTPVPAHVVRYKDKLWVEWYGVTYGLDLFHWFGPVPRVMEARV